jgi:hypothetical protein
MSLADVRGVSDRPIAPVSQPAVQIATALVRFLRSGDTRPPLTLAISGDWATGKSSILALLRAELRANACPAVLFNAFDHQTERDLLAAVLQRMEEAVPPWWRLAGVNFRRRLLLIRLARRRQLLVGSIAAVALVSGYLLANHSGSPIATIAAQWPTWPQIRDSGAGVWVGLLAASPVLALLISLADLLLQARPRAGRVTRSELRRRRDFRGRVTDDIRDLVQALQPRTPTLLIDDLDRCSPRAVVNILQAVHVLTNAIDCFVVLGMNRPIVERSLELQLSGSNRAMLDRHSRAAARDEAEAANARDLSIRYLNTLIGVEVMLPAPGADLGPAAPPEPRGAMSHAWNRWQPALAPATAGAIVLTLGVVAGYTFPLLESPTVLSIGGLSVSAFVAGWFGCLALLAVVPLIYLVGRFFEPRYLARDAAELGGALFLWFPVTSTFTPREVKRFVTQIRLLAHLEAAPLAISTSVALLALRKLDPRLLDGDDIERNVADYVRTGTDVARSLGRAMTEHRQHYDWPPSKADLDRFRRSVDLIRVS